MPRSTARRRCCADPFAQRWSVWAAGYGGSQTTDGNAVLGSNTTTSRICGVAVGADYRFSPFTLAGFALAGGGTNFSRRQRSGQRPLRPVPGRRLRASHRRPGLYLGGAGLRLAGHHHRPHRDHRRRRSAARAVQRQRLLRAASRAAIVLSRRGWRRHHALCRRQFTTFDLPAYAEQALAGANTFALTYGAKERHRTRSELGVRTDKSCAMPDAILTLRGRVAWAHDFNPDRNIGATFQTLPGASLRRQRRGAGA